MKVRDSSPDLFAAVFTGSTPPPSRTASPPTSARPDSRTRTQAPAWERTCPRSFCFARQRKPLPHTQVLSSLRCCVWPCALNRLSSVRANRVNDRRTAAADNQNEQKSDRHRPADAIAPTERAKEERKRPGNDPKPNREAVVPVGGEIEWDEEGEEEKPERNE